MHFKTLNKINDSFLFSAALKKYQRAGIKATLVLLVFTLSNTAAVYAQGFESVTRLTPFDVTKNSGEVSQSKLWKYDGKWWSVFPISSGTYIWRLDGTTWTNVLKISSSSMTKADCKAVDDVCHILLWREYDYSSMLVSVAYDPAIQNYRLWPQRPSTTLVNLDSAVETATIDIDGAGRMWLASDGVTDIRVRWSDPPYHTWRAPIIIASGVSDDDIGTVIALPTQGKVGVFWSNQNTQRFGFKTHQNGASPATWSADEVPGSQSALNIKSGMADDHIDLAVSSGGVLYAAFKTGYDTPGYPKIGLLKRQTSGDWDNVYAVSDTGTKPIVIINDATSKLKVIFPSESGSNILYRESPLQGISFGSTHTLLSGSYDNPTSTKDNYDQDVVILATDNINRQIVGVLASDIPAAVPAAPILVTPENLSTDQRSTVTLGWEYSEYATAYRVQVSAKSDFSTLYLERTNVATNSLQLENLSIETKYFWRVQASNSKGSSNWSAAWSFTVNPSPNIPGLAAYWKMDEGTSTTILDDSGSGNNGQTTGSPSWTTGVSGSALTFNGLNQYATVPDNTSLDISKQITLAAWIRPQKTASQKIIIKGDSKLADGYELGLLSSGKVSFRINQFSSDTRKINSSILDPINGTWMHVAGTFNGTEMKIYINGVKNKSITFNSPLAIGTNNLALLLGASIDETSLLKGAIDDARIYSYALSDSEVYDLATLPGQKADGTARVAVSGLHPMKDKETHEGLVEVFPNPAENTLFVNLPRGTEYKISVFDQYGRTVYSTTTGQESQVAIPLDQSEFTTGLYLLSIQSQNSSIVKKFLKK